MAEDIGVFVNRLHELKQQKKVVNEHLKKLNISIAKAELFLLSEMQNQELFVAGNEFVTIYRGNKTVPKVINWDEFYEFIYLEKAGYMLERRPAVTACREMFEEGILIPGVDPHTFEEVRTRSKS